MVPIKKSMVRNFYVALLLIFSSYQATAQAIYLYDVSGNRVRRQFEPSLPVTLVSFAAEKSTGDQQQPSALLKWRTASEVNSDHFDIQRSGDGKKWQEIGAVVASGDKASDTDYSFIDEAPMDGENLYRLKMVDKDDTFAYSRIQSLNFGTLTVLYPNPVKARLRIRGLPAGEAVTCKVQIWDATGRLVRQLTGVSAEGIDMALLPTGIYTVSIARSKGSTIVRKVVKE